MTKDNYYIITGGPGVGKTTLVKQLEGLSYKYVPEVAREIIKNQVEIGGDALPWGDAQAYSKLMLELSVRDYELYLQNEDILFFDRGIPDTLGYEILMDFPENKDLWHIANNYRYNNTVFLLPFWREIYETDDERKQDFREAEETYKIMRQAYESLSYAVVEVPKISPKERAEFVLSHLNQWIV